IRLLILFVPFSFRFVAATCYKHGKLPRINSLIIAFTRNIVLKSLLYSGCPALSGVPQPLPALEKFAVPACQHFTVNISFIIAPDNSFVTIRHSKAVPKTAKSRSCSQEWAYQPAFTCPPSVLLR